MNTLRILKGKDIDISVDGEKLCFVTDFVAKKSSQFYKIEEFLCAQEVDGIKVKTSYELTLTALTHLDQSVFDKEKFTLCVSMPDNSYEYSPCHLKSVEHDVSASKPIVNRFTIIAENLSILEVSHD